MLSCVKNQVLFCRSAYVFEDRCWGLLWSSGSCIIHAELSKERDPFVGIINGFAVSSGLILSQICLMIDTPGKVSLILQLLLAPILAIALMFIITPVEGHNHSKLDLMIYRPDGSCFSFTYRICRPLAAYILGILLVEDVVEISQLWSHHFWCFLSLRFCLGGFLLRANSLSSTSLRPR